jgi:bifunctional UDP-N-acetylglucosamine pyrophosphorylase / glucosamine-1-phosphate N-acetyltransferase
LSYIADARAGAETNIGAGTIFCNYNGFNKNRRDAGAGVFTSSNSAPVAHVRTGDGAYVAAGSTIRQDVEGQPFSIEYAEQAEKPGRDVQYKEEIVKEKNG